MTLIVSYGLSTLAAHRIRRKIENENNYLAPNLYWLTSTESVQMTLTVLGVTFRPWLPISYKDDGLDDSDDDDSHEILALELNQPAAAAVVDDTVEVPKRGGRFRGSPLVGLRRNGSMGSREYARGE